MRTDVWRSRCPNTGGPEVRTCCDAKWTKQEACTAAGRKRGWPSVHSSAYVGAHHVYYVVQRNQQHNSYTKFDASSFRAEGRVESLSPRLLMRNPFQGHIETVFVI